MGVLSFPEDFFEDFPEDLAEGQAPQERDHPEVFLSARDPQERHDQDGQTGAENQAGPRATQKKYRAVRPAKRKKRRPLRGAPRHTPKAPAATGDTLVALDGAAFARPHIKQAADAKAARPAPPLYGRLLALTLAGLLCFGLCEARLYVLALDDDASCAVRRQSDWTCQLTDGRGIFYDHALRPLTDTTRQAAAVAVAGAQAYTDLFAAAVPEDRAALYAGVGDNAPQLVHLQQQPAGAESFTFTYPLRYGPLQLAQHLIGYCDSEGRGVAGLERAFDDYLAGGSDIVTVRCATDALSQAAGSAAPRLRLQQGSGNALQLSLDSVIQRIAEDVACQFLLTGAIVVLQPATGRILASVSMPQYDPHDVYKSIQAGDTALINRAFSSYNVGSIYKPLLAALALENGLDAAATYHCTGSIEVDGHTYHCARLAGHGEVDMAGALQQSCNCYFIWLGQQLAAEDIVDFSALCGLGSATQLGGYCAGSGNLPDAALLQNSGELAGLCFGQGKLTATPLQMAAAFNIFANGGVYVRPTLVEGRVNSYTGQVTENLYRPCQLQVVSPKTADTLREMLVGVVEEGLGAGAAIPQAAVGGKTGTAQTGRTRKRDDGSESELYESWFVGFYPAEAPRYTIAVMMDSTDITGEAVAPVFAQLCQQLYYLEMR